MPSPCGHGFGQTPTSLTISHKLCKCCKELMGLTLLGHCAYLCTQGTRGRKQGGGAIARLERPCVAREGVHAQSGY
eukprot:4940612-Amphidinium_carterae.1